MDPRLKTHSCQRMAPRVAVWGPVGFLAPGGETFSGRMRDLSLTGVRAITQKVLPLETRVEVMLPLSADDVPLRMVADVVWSEIERRTEQGVEFLNGMQFFDLGPGIEQRLRDFIDSRIWSILDCLGRMPALGDFNDLERLSMSAVCLAFELQAGDELNAHDMDGGIALIQDGQISMQTLTERNEVHSATIYEGGDIAGSPPPEHGVAACRWIAESHTLAVVIPREGLEHIRSAQAQIAVKLMSAYCANLERKLRRLQAPRRR